MKRNAVTRIILYSVLFLLLTGILVSALGVSLFAVGNGSSTTSSQGSVSAAGIEKLSIDWAAGSVTILTGDTDTITLSETGKFSEKYTMAYEVKGNTLQIEYARSTVTVGFGSMPSKDLKITVPKDWYCSELEVDAAAVELTASDLSVGNLELDCAAGNIQFNGSVETVDCDGAAVELSITAANKPRRIELDGAACELALSLPEGTGYAVQMDSLGCEFHSNVGFSNHQGTYTYGDESCQVLVDGLGSDITINIAN